MFKAFFIMVSEVAKALGIKIERQSETEILKTVKKSYKQEDLILDMAAIISKYIDSFNTRDKMKAKSLLNRIKKVN